MMQRHLINLMFALALLIPVGADAVTAEDFQVKDTQGLINLCTAGPDDPQRREAVHFCHGFLVGAFHYYKATHAAPESTPLFCFPDPLPTRNDVIARFVTWAQNHPEYMAEPAVETEFRFLIETWPCQ